MLTYHNINDNIDTANITKDQHICIKYNIDNINNVDNNKILLRMTNDNNIDMRIIIMVHI